MIDNEVGRFLVHAILREIDIPDSKGLSWNRDFALFQLQAGRKSPSSATSCDMTTFSQTTHEVRGL
jgi:hypothetical protein